MNASWIGVVRVFTCSEHEGGGQHTSCACASVINAIGCEMDGATNLAADCAVTHQSS